MDRPSRIILSATRDLRSSRPYSISVAHPVSGTQEALRASFCVNNIAATRIHQNHTVVDLVYTVSPGVSSVPTSAVSLLCPQLPQAGISSLNGPGWSLAQVPGGRLNCLSEKDQTTLRLSAAFYTGFMCVDVSCVPGKCDIIDVFLSCFPPQRDLRSWRQVV